MALAYNPPGISISESVSPSYSPTLVDATSICLVGPAQGYEAYSEILLLDDNAEVALSADNPDPSTLVVLDASDVTKSPFVSGSDYIVDTSALTTDGVVQIRRAMQTNIANGEAVTVYFENSASPAQADGKTESLVLNRTTASAPVNRATGTQTASLIVAKQGQIPATDFTITGAGTASVTLVWKNTAVATGKFQTVYVDYIDSNSVQHKDVAYQLNNLSAVTLPANSTGHVVKNAAGADTTKTAVAYQKGSTTDLDYIVAGTGTTLTIARSAGTTQMGVTDDRAQVRVTYRATPSDYWLPTRCYSQADVENKYGAAFDNQGNIANPVAFGASLVFQGGASSVIVQALFSLTNGVKGAPTGAVTDWQNTLLNLRDIEDINVIVPLVATGGLTSTDALNLQILESVQDHINFMASENQFVIGLAGEDSTQSGQASKTTLRAHAQALGSRNPDDSFALLSPGSYQFANPVTGAISTCGGQYAACTAAGMMGRYPVQTSLTKMQTPSFVGLGETRSTADKNADAAAGLMVVESNRGRIQIRHAITVSQVSRDRQELSVVRAKHYVLENLRYALDTSAIGQILLDNNATFRVQLIVETVLNQMVDRGVIVSFHDVQARRDPNNPTAVQVRFSYLPAFPLNNIDLGFSIDTSQGITFDSTSANVQGL